MADKALMEGAGICDPRFRLRFKPAQEALRMGAGPEIFRQIFAAVHHANRHSTPQDYAAIVLPGARISGEVPKGEQGFGDLGDTVTVFGSEEILTRIRDDARFLMHLRNGALKARLAEIDETQGADGVALTRIRSCEKRSEGWQRRNEARRARRAEHISATKGTITANKTPAAAGRDLHVRIRPELILSMAVHRGTYVGGTVTVNTFGLSAQASPDFLPEAPDVRD